MRYTITVLVALTACVLMALFGLFDMAQDWHLIGQGLNPKLAYSLMALLIFFYGGFLVLSIFRLEEQASQVCELEDDLKWVDLRSSLPRK
jgi:hypothetical protein